MDGSTVLNALIRRSSSETCLDDSISRSLFSSAATSLDNDSSCTTSRSCKIDTTACLYFLSPSTAKRAIGTGFSTLNPYPLAKYRLFLVWSVYLPVLLCFLLYLSRLL